MSLLLLLYLTAYFISLQVENVFAGKQPNRHNEFGFAKFDFWSWNVDFLDWLNTCEKTVGNATVQTRITGGNLAEMNMFPYQAGLLLLQYPRVYQCGGALINAKYVLTAAHCLYRATRGKVFLGSNEYANPKTALAVYNVTWSDFQIYEGYAYRGGFDDIGLIYLKKPAPLSAAIQIIPLARSFMTSSFLNDEIVTASGWGRLNDANDTDVNLQLYYVDLPVLAQKECACFFKPGLVRERNHICTNGVGGRGSCDGDSGGPLTVYYKNITYLVGLTAFGSAGGCEIGYPSVYTRVTSYLEWIARRTGISIE